MGEVMVDETSTPEPEYEWQKPKATFDFGRMMSRTFSGVFSNFKTIFLGILAIVAITTILSIPIYLTGDLESSDVSSAALYTASGLAILSALISFVSYMLICVFTDLVVFNYHTNRPITMLTALKRGAIYTLPILLIVILYFIASYIGMIFFIIPGVIISVGWAVIGPAYLHEETSLFGSFGRSWYLTNGYKWWVWLATFVMGIITMLLWIIPLTAFAGIIGSGMDLETGEMATQNWSIILLSAAISLFSYFALALYASFITSIYIELRDLKEGIMSDTLAEVFA